MTTFNEQKAQYKKSFRAEHNEEEAQNFEAEKHVYNEELKSQNLAIEKHVGKKIKLFRQLQAYSQSDVASHLGITFQQFQKYESGKNRIPISRLMKLAEIFRVNMNVFFDNNVNVMFEDIMKKGNRLSEEVVQIEVSSNSNRESPFGLNHIQNDSEAQDLMKNFNRINDPAVRSHICMLVKSLADKKS